MGGDAQGPRPARGKILHFALLGALCGLGLLAKATVLPFVAALGLFLTWRVARAPRWRRARTPGPPPFSSMNSTPAVSKARRTRQYVLLGSLAEARAMSRFSR
jgi:hypothetical protein